jgi:predicted alpha/beta-hydrolase family hydrolase
VRFDFPYMEKAAALNKRQPPNPMGVLQQDFLDVIAQVRGDLPCFIGGKSMGGRVATLIADKADCRGIVCFGYPFHPPGKPEKVRTEHLFELTTPLCIVQGERDTFGKPDEIQAYRLPASITVHFLPSGDHSFKPLKSSGENQTQLVQSAVAQAARFLEELL